MQYQDTFKNPASVPEIGPLQFIGNFPERLVTAASYWSAAIGPISEMLEDPEAEFEQIAIELQSICAENGIRYRPASPTSPAAFPAWLFLKVYSLNP